MDEPDRPQYEAFDGADSANVFDRDVVDFQAMVARLSVQHPGVSVSRLHMMVIAETEAMTGGVPIAVPADVYDGVAELIAQGIYEDLD
jgi:hypothetical protein